MKIVRRLFSFQGLRDATVLAAMTALGGGAAFAAVEDRSTWDGVYWAITTMTTVGYGDLAPKTDGGRVIAILVMFVGIGFLTLVIRAIAQRFVETEVREVEEVVGEELEATKAVLSELRTVVRRLQRLEARVQRLAP
jgi:voltage-gated potassium channel